MQARVAKVVHLPEGYRLTWGGEFENQRRAMKRLQVIVPISVLLIFFLLFMTFRSALPALVVLLDIPFAVVGGIFALYLTHTELSVSSAVGFITLFGVSVMNGVLIVTYLRRASAAPRATEESILRTVSGRIRPVLMTALPASDRPLAGGAGAHHRLRHAAAVRDRDRGWPASGDAAHDVAAASLLPARRSLVRQWLARAPSGSARDSLIHARRGNQRNHVGASERRLLSHRPAFATGADRRRRMRVGFGTRVGPARSATHFVGAQR